MDLWSGVVRVPLAVKNRKLIGSGGNNCYNNNDQKKYHNPESDGKRVTTTLVEPRLLEKPWREHMEWTEESMRNLMIDVEQFSPAHTVNITQSRILIMGPIGAGKSSFINTIASVFRGRVTRQAPSGSAERSITSQYRMYRVKGSSGQSMNFRLCDTRGIEENQEMDANSVSYLLEGNVPEGHQFNPTVPISTEIPGFERNTTLKDRIHCVCFVIDGSTAGVLSEKILQCIKEIQRKIYLKGIPQMILLTKIDKVCLEVEQDLSYVFRSKAVLEQVDKVSQLLGVPRNSVLPIKNYEQEIKVNENVNILALISLLEILRASEDYLYNFLDEVTSGSDNDLLANKKD